MDAKTPLCIESISKSFKNKDVINNVSLEIKPKEIFGLVGLNGVGKTTLIKIILDLLKSNEGDASFFGESIKKKNSRKNISYLPEKFHPSQFLKGTEFLELALSYYNKKLNIDEANKMANSLGLDPHALHQKVSKYSKGMGQKLGLLSVFLTNSPLLILDEPMSGLDPQARIQLKDLFLSYKKKGNSIFFSSHILADIEEVCDRIAIIHDNKIIYIGTAKEFLKEFKEKNLERAFLKAIS